MDSQAPLVTIGPGGDFTRHELLSEPQSKTNSDRVNDEALANLNEALDAIETQAELLHRERHENGMAGQRPNPNQRRRLMRLISALANAECAAYRELQDMRARA